MFDKINFDVDKPYFQDGNTKWYLSKYLNDYLTEKQASNLEPLKNLYCFIVKGDDDVEDLVLVDNQQNVINYTSYNLSGYEQMIAHINILKISKHFEKND